MVWKLETSQGYESDKIAHLVVPYVRGNGIDIGCGTRTVWPHITGVETGHHFGRGAATVMMPSFEEFKLPYRDGGLDFVFSSHCLEHIKDYAAALHEWWRVIRPGGWLTLYLPHREFYPNIGQFGSNPDHKHDFMPVDIKNVMTELAENGEGGWDLVEDEERNQHDEYSFFQVYQKRADSQRVERPWRREPGKKYALVIRYGDAVGDHILAASPLPALKKQGFTIIMNTTPSGYHLLEHDPHIDGWWLQEKGEVPIDQLGPYFAALKVEGRWDRIVNFTECIETQLLTHPNNPRDQWSDEVRQAVCGSVSYLEQTHRYAAAPFDFRPRFFPSLKESVDARLWRHSIGNHPLVAFPLVGSSFHKVHPKLDIVIAWLLQRVPDVRIAIFGDKDRGRLHGQAIRASLALNNINIDRIVWHCGDMGIRDALARVKQCNVVAGGETGLLWAVAFEHEVRKVMMLSHSSEQNFLHWKRTIFLKPDAAKTPCFPCHRMHYFENLSRCNIVHDEQGQPAGAACCFNVDPEEMVSAIIKQLRHCKLALPDLAAD